MKRLLFGIACLASVSCADSLFAPVAAVSAPGAAVLDYAGQHYNATSTFEGPSLSIVASSGEYLLALDVAELRGGRPRLGRHRLQIDANSGAEFRFYQRYPVIPPPSPVPGAPVPEFVIHDLAYRVRAGFLEITSSSPQELRGVLYVRADAGHGSGEFTIRSAFFARPPKPMDGDRRVHIPATTQPIPVP